MSTTGLSAQAKGLQDHQQSARVLYQSMGLALALAVIILLLQQPLLWLGVTLADAPTELKQVITDYFVIRVWGAPAVLTSLALIGWLIGQQRNAQVMWIQIIGNLINVVMDLVAVYWWNWGVQGVAFASVLAEYSICAMSLWVARERLFAVTPSKTWFKWTQIKHMLSANRDMFVRNLSLQVCLAFVTLQGARFGELTAATNAILMQFTVLMALGLDAVANAIEALVGEAKGQKNAQRLRLQVYQGLAWSTLFALLYAIIYALGFNAIVQLLTNNQNVIEAAQNYWWIVISLPLIAHWCFLYDGVYVGLTRAAAMRNSMLISAFAVFFPFWWLLSVHANHGLWYALLAMFAARGITLAVHFVWLDRQAALVD